MLRKVAVAAASNPHVEIRQDGEKFYIKTSTSVRTTEINFHMGEEFDEETVDGRKCKVNEPALIAGVCFLTKKKIECPGHSFISIPVISFEFWKAASMWLRAEGLKIPPLQVAVTVTSVMSFEFLSLKFFGPCGHILISWYAHIFLQRSASAAAEVCFYSFTLCDLIFVIVVKKIKPFLPLRMMFYS